MKKLFFVLFYFFIVITTISIVSYVYISNRGQIHTNQPDLTSWGDIKFKSDCDFYEIHVNNQRALEEYIKENSTPDTVLQDYFLNLGATEQQANEEIQKYQNYSLFIKVSDHNPKEIHEFSSFTLTDQILAAKDGIPYFSNTMQLNNNQIYLYIYISPDTTEKYPYKMIDVANRTQYGISSLLFLTKEERLKDPEIEGILSNKSNLFFSSYKK